ncbi:TPA: carboxymuconolactone decarboxylase family protein [Methanosarcina acetivorans]|uniref:4-carboxymuconolactone decarboxylase n=2 Tax=Methanosarcina acetivorans TaxID=2214 RepID=Q8TP59_METAC|nr:carboxymuconolactone decarboxylase family protein [Methanosarcina acetivorans]AAM05461.1 4-carboxymuconolactone decarboxylase [Methanosarcina acetivorans C2A]HIH94048.1 carboxymuconolactone decarboxylase family protein [Methanosarcina acetivorans]
MGKNIQEIKEVKGFMPKSVVYAEKINEDFGEGLASFYQAIWAEREDGLSMKQKHLMVFAIACSNNNIESAVKILERLKKFEATRAEISDAMMIAAWTGGIQNFTDFSVAVLKEMEKLGF